MGRLGSGLLWNRRSGAAMTERGSIVSLASASASTRLAVGLSLVLELGAVYAFTCEGNKDEHTQ
jgi:hypothetical protein